MQSFSRLPTTFIGFCWIQYTRLFRSGCKTDRTSVTSIDNRQELANCLNDRVYICSDAMGALTADTWVAKAGRKCNTVVVLHGFCVRVSFSSIPTCFTALDACPSPNSCEKLKILESVKRRFELHRISGESALRRTRWTKPYSKLQPIRWQMFHKIRPAIPQRRCPQLLKALPWPMEVWWSWLFYQSYLVP